MMLGLVATTSWAGAQTWCVFDPLGTQGDISRRLQDIRLYALQHKTQLKFDTFKDEKNAIQAFDQNKCSGLVASNFHTYRYNHFMGSTAGIGLISNNRVARMLLQLFNHPNVERRMVGQDYEVLGMIPLLPNPFWSPMSAAFIGGLSVATPLGLLFVPALYSFWYKVKEPEDIVEEFEERAEEKRERKAEKEKNKETRKKAKK